MLIICIGVVYLLLLSWLIRFFQAVHRWDEEIRDMTMESEERQKHTSSETIVQTSAIGNRSTLLNH
jgi:hypothetical protein